MQPVRVEVGVKRLRPPKVMTPFALAYGFAILIALGTFLLLLPPAHQGGGFTPFVIALFTAASAASVTGLLVVESASYWSPFGKVVILILVQLGGLGIITYSTLMFIALGRKIGLRERLVIRGESGTTAVGGVVGAVKQLGLVMLGIEAVGFVALAARFSFDFPFPTALWHSLFHTVSSFNNAGFVILPGGLGAYRQDVSTLLITTVLLFLGGISIVVMADVVRHRRFGRLSLDSKLVISATAGILVLAMVMFLVTEWSNPATLGPMGVPGKVLSAFFESSSARTAGFTSVSVGDFAQSTLLFTMALMFIGGAAASTAGGIKVNSFGVIIASVIATLRGRSRAEAYNREIPGQQVSMAITIGVLGGVGVFVMAIVLTQVEEGHFLEVLFETFSAFGTSGYSTGLPAEMSATGQVLLTLAMYLGRVGPLTLVLWLVYRRGVENYRYAQERIRMG